MMILIIKALTLTNGTKTLKFKRMCIYEVPDKIAISLIDSGHAVNFGYMGVTK